MAETALSRIARALDLVPFISANPGIAISDLASEFETTEKEIIKDLNLLFVCGIPGYSPADLIDISFDSGFVTIIDAQTLDRPRKLGWREVVSIILSLENLATQRPEGDSIRIELETLRARLVEIVRLRNLQVAAVPSKKEPPRFLSSIQEALRNREFLEIEYVSGHRDVVTRRVVRPDDIYLENGNYYLRAFCYLAASDRTFRIDRIRECNVAPEPTQVGEATPEAALAPVLLEIKRSERLFLEENRSILKVVQESGEYVVAEALVTDPEWVLRICLSHLGRVRLLEPAPLLSELQARLNQVRNLYGAVLSTVVPANPD